MIRVADFIQSNQTNAMALVPRWREEGISGVICVAHNTDVVYDPWLPLLRMAHDDQITPTPGWWAPVFAFYDWARKQGTVLIHCQAGANRSTGVAAVFLVTRHGYTPSRAMEVMGRPGYAAWIRAVEGFGK